MENTLLFLLFMLPGTFFLGLSDVFIRKILRNGVDERLFLTLTSFIITISFLFILLLTGIPEIKEGFWLALGITAFLNVIAVFIWYRAFKLEEASTVSPFNLLSPPLVLITGWLFLGERPSILGIFGVIFIILGLWKLLSLAKVIDSFSLSNLTKRPGIIYALLGVLLVSFSFPFDKKAVVLSSAIFVIPCTWFIIALFHLLGILFYKRKQVFKTIKKLNIKSFFVFITVSMAGIFLSFHALNFAFAAYASGLKRLWPLWTVLLSGKFLQEKGIKDKALATLIMLIGIFIMILFG